MRNFKGIEQSKWVHFNGSKKDYVVSSSWYVILLVKLGILILVWACIDIRVKAQDTYGKEKC